MYICFTFLEQLKSNDRVLRKTQRDLERDRNKMEREEKKLVITQCKFWAIFVLFYCKFHSIISGFQIFFGRVWGGWSTTYVLICSVYMFVFV